MAVVLSYIKPSVMIFHRRLLIRASLFLNFCVLTYVALQAAQSGGGGGGNFNMQQQQNAYNGETDGIGVVASTNPALSSLPSQLSTEMETETSSTSEQQQQLMGSHAATLPESTAEPDRQQTTTEVPLPIDCQERERRFSYSQRGSYWILNHYIPSDKVYGCNESVTYTTHGDVTFLDNIIPLATRWDGPLSVTVYTPGSDYELAIRSIAYLRQCTEDDIRQKVSFHFVLDERHFPPALRKLHPQQGMEPPLTGTPAKGSTTSSPEAQGQKRVVMVII